MQVVYQRCCGLDIHKKLIVACLVRMSSQGVHKEIRTFSTILADLYRLRDWLVASECQMVAMESTGVYWKPIWNVLEEELELLLVNAQHIKAVPGRKTDTKDAEWIADLLQHGLLRASFVPPRPQRELREVTRYRSKLVAERARLVNRIQKVLEDSNVKLASVATDITGVSGRAILQALLDGEDDPEVLAELARGRRRSKHDKLAQTARGTQPDHQRFLLTSKLRPLDGYDLQIAELDQEIARPLALQTSEGNRWLRQAIIETAHGAARSKNTYLGAYYQRLKKRMGSKKAIVALAHRILVIIYHLLKEQQSYRELGPGHADEQAAQSSKRWAIRRLEQLGFAVTLTPKDHEEEVA